MRGICTRKGRAAGDPYAEGTETGILPGTFERFRQVSAVFAVSDYYAIDLMHFLTEEGFSVPEDISIAGFDDTPMCEMVHPALTTVKQDGALRAEIAIEKLQELREGTLIGTEIRLPVLLMIRDSTCKR